MWIVLALPLAAYYTYTAWEYLSLTIRYQVMVDDILKTASLENERYTGAGVEVPADFVEAQGRVIYEMAQVKRKAYLRMLGYILLSMTLIALPLIYKAFVATIRVLKSRKIEAPEKMTAEIELAPPGAELNVQLGNKSKNTEKKSIKKVLIFIASVALVFLVASWFYFTSYRPKSIATDHVARELIDPDSAKFRDVQIVGNAICGEVNAKNRQGGYTGFTSFVYLIDKEVVGMERDTEYLSGAEKYAVDQLNDSIHSLCK